MGSLLTAVCKEDVEETEAKDAYEMGCGAGEGLGGN